MSGKVKRVQILKNEAQSDVEYSDKNSFFELQIFFKWLYKIFFKFYDNVKVSERSDKPHSLRR